MRETNTYDANTHQRMPVYLRRAIARASIISLGLLVALLIFAISVSTGANQFVEDTVRAQLLTGAFVASICAFPLVLFIIRLRQWASKQAKHPSVPLCLLATAALIPFLFGVGILFIG